VTPQRVEQPCLRQGMLENSNVNVIEEMVNMITLQRSHEVLGKIVQTIDEITSKRIDAARG
jgi:flagellar basal-body rod protein FlgG